MSKMTRFFGGAVFATILLFGAGALSPQAAQAASLTSDQISAIIGLLQSFGADQTTINNVQTALGGTPTGGGTKPWCHTFNRDLTVGVSGDDVSALNQALTASGIDTTGNSSSFTENSAGDVVSFQAKYGIRQTGYVGPITRRKLNSLYGCNGTVITQTIQVISPNGGELWQKGTTQNIKWSAPSSVSSVNISLESWFACLYMAPRCAIAQTLYTLAASAQNNGLFEWTVGKDAAGADIPAGQYIVGISAADGSVGDSSDKPFSIVAASSALTITTTSLPSATAGTKYEATISASGGSWSYSWSAGTLPPGLSLVSGVCIMAPCQVPATISGTPTTAGTYTFTVTVTNSIQKASQSFTMTVGKQSNPLSINPANATITKVGGTTEFQAMYQPSYSCEPPRYCAAIVSYPVQTKWTSSNPKVAAVAYKEIPCPAGTNCFAQQFDYLTAVVTGVSLGTATITATYTDSSGAVFTASVPVSTAMQ